MLSNTNANANTKQCKVMLKLSNINAVAAKKASFWVKVRKKRRRKKPIY